MNNKITIPEITAYVLYKLIKLKGINSKTLNVLIVSTTNKYTKGILYKLQNLKI